MNMYFTLLSLKLALNATAFSVLVLYAVQSFKSLVVSLIVSLQVTRTLSMYY